MYFASNIKFLRKRKQLTQDEEAFSLGLKRSTLGGYENNIAQPDIDTLIAFSRYFNISIDTILKIDLTALSESKLALLENGLDSYITGTHLRVLATSVDSDNRENVEMVPLKAAAGYLTGYADPEFINTLPVFQLPFLSLNRKYRAFQLSGDSMLPIPDKSWVICEFIENWSLIKDLTSCIILTLDDGIIFKQMVNKIKSNGSFILYSLNPVYDPYEIRVINIREIWRFNCFISFEMPKAEQFGSNLLKVVENLRTDMNLIKKKINIK